MSKCMINKAYEFAKEKHKYQVDKSGNPYFYHPETVSELVEDLFEYDSEIDKNICITLAYLHDTLEDTDTTSNEIYENFGVSISILLQELTHTEELSYMDYIKKLSDSEHCRRVKIADLVHNSNLMRLSKISIKDVERNQKYMKALKYLIEKENEDD